MSTPVLFRNLWGLCTAVTGLCRNAQLWVPKVCTEHQGNFTWTCATQDECHSLRAADAACGASTADGHLSTVDEQQLKRTLWVAAIKVPMYSVGVVPIVVSIFFAFQQCSSCAQPHRR